MLRLELCSTFLLSELIYVIKDQSPDLIHESVLRTDSEIALSWILKRPAKGVKFVLYWENEIKKLTSTKIWQHIFRKYNEADCATQSVNRYLLKDNNWGSGPASLYGLSNPFLLKQHLFQTFLLIH